MAMGKPSLSPHNQIFMKKLFFVLTAALMIGTAQARSEAITLAWNFSDPMTNIVFQLWLNTNAVNTNFVAVASTTNLLITYTNTSPNILQFYVTASNTVRQAISPPSNIVQLPAIPIVPANLRLISITVTPGP